MEVLSFQILTAIDGAQTTETKELLYRDVLIFFLKGLEDEQRTRDRGHPRILIWIT
jgi:hypothetical protein